MFTTPVTFDNVTGQHEIVSKLIANSFQKELRVVYKSRNKVGSVLCPKRGTISKLSKILDTQK